MIPGNQTGLKRSEETKALMRAAWDRNRISRIAKGRRRNSKRPYESLYNHFVYVAKHHRIPVEITFEEFLKFTAISTCFYCKEPVKWSVRNIPVEGAGYNLDRKITISDMSLKMSWFVVKSVIGSEATILAMKNSQS